MFRRLNKKIIININYQNTTNDQIRKKTITKQINEFSKYSFAVIENFQYNFYRLVCDLVEYYVLIN